MALQNASGGSFTDLDELAKDKTLVVFRVRQLLEERPSQFPGNTIKPVLADMLICSGERKGEVTRNDDIIGAGVTGTLRRAGEGKDVAARLEVITQPGRRPYIGAQTCTDEELAKIGPVYEDGKGFDAPAPILQNAGAVSSPVGDDDEPPF
jgi:hypothetical protein